MKSVRFALTLLAMLALVSIPVLAFGQEVPATSVQSLTMSGDPIAVMSAIEVTKPAVPVDAIQQFIDGLSGKYGWITTVLLFIGALRVVLKPLHTWIDSYIASTPSKEDDEWLAKIENSAFLRWFLWLLDLFGSIKVGGVNPMKKDGGKGVMALLMAIGLGATFFFAVGCAKLAPGADPLIVRCEQVQTVAASTFDTLQKIDNSNRAFFKTNAPGFHNFAEWLREPVVEVTNVTEVATTNAPEFYGLAEWIAQPIVAVAGQQGPPNQPKGIQRGIAYLQSLDNVKLAYKRGEADKSKVVRVLSTVETALAEAQKLIAQTATPSK